MAHEADALRARGATVVAISPDPPDKARAMAREYGIEFPLLEDTDLELAKKYSGVSESGFPMPSTYILGDGGRVLFRKVGETKDDRASLKEILAELDAARGQAGAPLGLRGYDHPWQLTADLGLGAHSLADDTSFAGDVSARAVRSLGRFASVGAEAGTLLLPSVEVRGAALLQAQLPLWADVANLYLQVPVGVSWSASESSGDLFTGLRLGTAFDASPTFQLRIETALESAHGHGRALFRIGAGFRL